MSEYTLHLAESAADIAFARDLLQICVGDPTGIHFGIEQVATAIEAKEEPLSQSFIVEWQQQPIGLISYGQTPSGDNRTRFFLGTPLILPEFHAMERLDYLFKMLLEHVQTHAPDELKMGLWDFQNDHIALAEAHGFIQTQKDNLSEIQLSEFDTNLVKPALERITAEGIELITLPDFMQENPDYKQALLDLVNTIFKDVPGFETNELKLAHFEKQFLEKPSILLDVWMLARDGEQLVGTSFGERFGSPDSQDCITQLTGVLRSHRRKGITMAMKIAQIKRLQDLGFKRIITGNEENNPMYQINLKLGFKPSVISYHYAKMITPE